MSPFDLKRIDKLEWVDSAKGEPTLVLFSVVDDQNGVGYQEYRCVYGEVAIAAAKDGLACTSSGPDYERATYPIDIPRCRSSTHDTLLPRMIAVIVFPNRCSITGFQGTRLKPMPSSSMAKRPLASCTLRR